MSLLIMHLLGTMMPVGLAAGCPAIERVRVAKQPLGAIVGKLAPKGGFTLVQVHQPADSLA